MNNSRIVTIKTAKLSGYCFYLNLNIWGNFQICISVPLTKLKEIKLFYLHCSCKNCCAIKLGEFKSDQNTSPDKLGNPENLNK